MAKAKKEIRVIYKRVGFDPVEVTIPNELDHIQMMIGGDIEVLHWYGRKDTLLLVDDEGRIKNRPFNFMFYEPIVGSVMWVGVKGEDFTDCPLRLDDFRTYYDWLFDNEEEKS